MHRLDRRLDSVAHSQTPSIWRRLFTTSFSMPLPVAAAAALLIAVTTIVAVRSLMFHKQAAPEASASVREVEVIKEVEKPVVVERVVTRTVYVQRPQTSSAASARRPTVPSLQGTPDMTASTGRNDTQERARAALNGFQPPPDVKLTVIKGSYPDEK